MSKQIYIDVETTGLDPKLHGLVQVAGAIVINGVLKESFDYSMCPPPDKTFDVRALEVINLDMKAIGNFASSEDMYDQFFKLVKKYVNVYDKKDKLHFLAYNSPFDVSFIRQWFLDNNNKYYGSMFWTPDICIMRKAGDLLQSQRHELKNFKLKTVCDYLDIESRGQLHNAMIDIELTKQLNEYIDENGGFFG